MKKIKHLFLLQCLLVSLALNSLPAKARELGAAYGSEFKENNDIEHYEIYFREPLPFRKELDSGLKLLSGVELGAALIREAGSDKDEVGRFSAMPQLILDLHPNVDLFMGLGVGFMIGDTEFTEQDLGGSFLLNSKIGIQFLLGHHFNVGYFFYHQSNAGIYSNNQGLNMHNVLLSYSF